MEGQGRGDKEESRESERSLFSEANLALGLDTIPCLLSPWSEWSDCSVTCGKGMRTRQRMLKSLAELGDCNEELEQGEKCMLPECRKSWGCWCPPALLPALEGVLLPGRVVQPSAGEKEHALWIC